MTKALTVSDLVAITAQPLIKDAVLGSRLGMARPTNIRKQIDANRAELERYGLVHATRAPITTGKGRVVEVTEFYLNEEQALLLCMFSRTEKAADVRQEVIAVYMAWRRGEFERSLPDPRAAELDDRRAHHHENAERWGGEIDRRKAALDTFDQARAGGASVTAAARAAAEQAGVCTHTIHSWRALVRMTPSCDRAAALTPQYRGSPGLSACHPEAWATLTRLLRGKRRKGFSDCYRRMRAIADQNGWSPVPSERSLRRRFNALLGAPTRVLP